MAQWLLVLSNVRNSNIFSPWPMLHNWGQPDSKSPLLCPTDMVSGKKGSKMEQAEHCEPLRMNRHHTENARRKQPCPADRIWSSSPAHGWDPWVRSILCISQSDQEGMENQRQFIQKWNYRIIESFQLERTFGGHLVQLLQWTGTSAARSSCSISGVEKNLLEINVEVPKYDGIQWKMRCHIPSIKSGWFFAQTCKDTPSKCINVYIPQKPNSHKEFFECLQMHWDKL